VDAAGGKVSEQTLKPCPFCGAEPMEHAIEPHKHEFCGMPDHPGSHVIECPRCECGMIAATKDVVFAAWNRRAALDQFGAKAEAQAVPDGMTALSGRVTDVGTALREAIGAQPVAKANAIQVQLNALDDIAEAIAGRAQFAAPVAESLTAAQGSTEPFGWLFGLRFWEATNKRITDDVKRYGKPLYEHAAPQPDRVAEHSQEFIEATKALGVMEAANNMLERITKLEVECDRLRNALKFYADGNHFIVHDESAWDTVSGEPSNFYEDEANTATVEDGSIAKAALAERDARRAE
jgi:hypothetical protein